MIGESVAHATISGGTPAFQVSGEGFRGTVWLDDFEVVESYNFQPDVDVRKNLTGIRITSSVYPDEELILNIDDDFSTLVNLQKKKFNLQNKVPTNFIVGILI